MRPKAMHTVMIYGKQWEIHLTGAKIMHEGQVCNGLCKYDQRKILIDRRLDDAALADTISHELQHAIEHEKSEGRITYEETLRISTIREIMGED